MKTRPRLLFFNSKKIFGCHANWNGFRSAWLCGTVTEHVVLGTEMVLVPTTTAPLSAADIHTYAGNTKVAWKSLYKSAAS